MPIDIRKRNLKNCSFLNTDYRARKFPIPPQIASSSSHCERERAFCGEMAKFGIFLNHRYQKYHSKHHRTKLPSNAIQFNLAHQLLLQLLRCNWCRFEIRTLEDTFQNCYCYCWTVHSLYYPDYFGILDIVQIDKAGWVSSQYSKNYATRPMRTDEQIVTGEYQIEHKDDHRVTCDMERCSLKPFCVPFSTSFVGFGT